MGGLLHFEAPAPASMKADGVGAFDLGANARREVIAEAPK
jgi:hypothetical protein